MRLEITGAKASKLGPFNFKYSYILKSRTFETISSAVP